MSYSIEAWRVPGVGVHEPIIKDVGFLRATIGSKLNGAAQSTIDVRSDLPRLDEIVDPQNNVETLLRLVRGETVLTSFWARNRTRNFQDAAFSTISGPGIEAGLDHGVIYPFDTPAGPPANFFSKNPDWKFGAGNSLLKNPGLEDGIASTSWEDGVLDGWTKNSGSGFKAPSALEVIDDVAEADDGTHFLIFDAAGAYSGPKSPDFSNEAGGGRYTASIRIQEDLTGARILFGLKVDSGQTIHHTNGFVFNGYAWAELGNVAKGAGSSSGVYQSVNVDVTLDAGQTSTHFAVAHVSPGGPDIRVDEFLLSAGPGKGIDPWEGVSASIVRSVSNVRTGSFSLAVTTDGAGASTGGHRQKVPDGRIISGRQYTLGAWIFHSEGGPETFRAVLKRPSGAWLSSETTVVPNNTYTFVSATATSDTDSLWFDIRAENAASVLYWADDMVFHEGQIARTAGDMIIRLLAPIQARGALSWLNTDDITALLDAGGNAWDLTLAATFKAGQTMRQVLDVLRKWGIEFLIAWDGTNYQLRAYNPGGAGTDRTTGTGPTGFKGGPFREGELSRVSPAFNAVLSGGADGEYQTATDPAQITAYGRREGYQGSSGVASGLSVVASELLDRANRNKFNMRALFRDTTGFLVYTNLALGDTVEVDAPPDLVEQPGRVWSITTIIDGQHVEPDQHIVEYRPA